MRLSKIKLPVVKLSAIKLPAVAFVLVIPLGILVGFFFSNIRGFVSGGYKGLLTPLNKTLYVAKVDGVGISKGEWTKFLRTRYGQSALKDLTDIYMVKGELNKAKITVSDGDIDAEIAKIEKQLAGQNLEELLKQQGRSLSDFRNDIYMRVGMQKLLSSKVVITDAEITDYVKTNGPALGGTTPEETKTLAREVLMEQKLGEQINTWFADLQSKVTVDTYLK